MPDRHSALFIVESPASVTFTETIAVPEGTAPGTYECTVQARIVGGSVLGEQTVTVTVTVPTPSPTPAPTAALSLSATPSPSPTPAVAAAVLPATGGPPSHGSGRVVPWLAVIAAAIAAVSAGGVWFAYQRRRVR